MRPLASGDLSSPRPGRSRRRRATWALLAALAGAAAAIALLVPSASSQTAGTGTTTLECTDGPAFDLVAKSGRISTPDGASVYMWGFADANLPDAPFQFPGPVLCVEAGDAVTVNLTNELDVPVSIVFPGQSGVTATGDTQQGLLAVEAGPGDTMTYSFTASSPGTYLYESGTNPIEQVELGLYGALVVRPAMGPEYAYDDASTRFDPGREFLIMVDEIDYDLHLAVERDTPFDPNGFHPEYFTINGRSFPDTAADNRVPWLPTQPYSALVRLEPYDSATNPYPALLRYLNPGSVNHPLHPHGDHVRVIGRDGRPLGNASMEAFTKTIGAGQTYDVLLDWHNVDQWSATNPLPVTVPNLRNLVFKDGATYYSGSPYLGQTGALPAGVVTFNQCGEFYFPIHSHALNEFQNFDEGFGGMGTLLRVDPPGGCP